MTSSVLDWKALRTDETREVERRLREEFQSADAYRFNPASVRVRIVDSRFRGLSREERDDLVEPYLAKLDPSTQSDIMNLVLLYPGEVDESISALLADTEFENPPKSML